MSKKYTTNFLEDTNGSTGSANQVLVSTAAGIDWVDGSGSGIIGGPYLPLSAGSGSSLTGTLYGTSTNFSGNGDYAGSMTLGTGASTAEANLQIGQGRTGNGYSYIDLIGDATYTDYGLRIIRNNAGANTSSAIMHRGTGNLEISSAESSSTLFKTNSTTALTLTNTQNAIFTGNVGIGTTSPTANLQISSANDGMNNGINTNQLKLSHGVSTAGYGSSLAFGVSSIDQFTGAKIVHERTASNSVGDLSFWTRQTSGNSTDYDLTVERMRILANGNVGIGTTGPVNKIQANYSPVAIASLTASAGTSSTNWNRNAFLMGTGASVSNALAFGVSGTANDRKAWIQSGHPDSAANSLGTISLNPLGGNVGIGTTSPDFKLDVNGDVRISSDQTNLIKISNESNEDYFNVSQSTNNKPTLSLGDIDEQYGTLLTVDVENEEVVIFTNGQIYIGDNGFGNSTKFIVDDVNEKFTFTNGDVGIGTTSPSQKLEVDGNVKAETLIATDLTDGYVPYSKSGTLGLQDSKIYTQGAGIGVGTTTLAAGCHITSLSNISATGYRVSAMQTAPSSRGDTGTLGEIRITADYIYVCYATDSWKRVAIAQW